MTRLSDKEIAEIKAREEAATPGPWHVDSIASEDGHGPFNAYVLMDANGSPMLDTQNSEIAEIHSEYDEDGRHSWDEIARRYMEFIAHSRTDVPRLLQEVEALKAERDAALAKEKEADATVDHYFDLLNTPPSAMGETAEVPKRWLVGVVKELAEFDLIDFAGSGKDGNSTRLLREFHSFSKPPATEEHSDD